MITCSVFQYMINDNVIFRAHMEQLVQDNPLNVEDRHKAKFPLWFKKKVSNLKNITFIYNNIDIDSAYTNICL